MPLHRLLVPSQESKWRFLMHFIHGKGVPVKITYILCLLMTVSILTTAHAADPGWPREINAASATIIMYQPQVETFKDNKLTGRAAVSVTPKGKTEPVFGAIWISARVETDRDTRMVEILEVDVTRVRLPDATAEQEKKFADLLEKEIPRWDLTLSLDRLIASLELAEKERIAAKEVKSTPPKIMFVDYPTVLVTLDGQPQLRTVENTDLMRVINTPFLIALDTKTKRYYLDGGQIWFVAKDVKGPWQKTDNPPAKVVALRPPESKEAAQESKTAPADEPKDDTPKDIRVPKIMVVTEPAELIVSDGQPKWTPIEGNELLYMSNTESDVLMEIQSQRYFVLMSGRWYAGKSLKGPWSYVPSNRMPASFAKIPPESEMGHVLIFVAGTEQADDAVWDSYIPQTAAVKRSEAKLKVTYDGKPKFEKIQDTNMKYAVNTSYSVILVKKKYYACYQGVWYVAGDPQGPWKVADHVPQEIYTIPPSSPIYNVRYVYIYNSTPDVVYVGYTPGYTGSYVYGGTIVYGTGWYYRPWYGTYYYPRPVTWGFHMRWNPWYGWSFGLSYHTGPFTFGIGFGGWHRGWWGPAGFHHGRHHGYRRGFYRGWHHGYRAGAHAGYRAGYRAGHRQNNIYKKKDNRYRNAHVKRPQNRQQARTAANRKNNVLTDKSGNAHRRTGDGWQKRENNSWKKSAPSGGSSRPATQPRSYRNRSSPERDYQARQRGSSRTQNYQRQRQTRSGGRSGAGRRR